MDVVRKGRVIEGRAGANIQLLMAIQIEGPTALTFPHIKRSGGYTTGGSLRLVNFRAVGVLSRLKSDVQTFAVLLIL